MSNVEPSLVSDVVSVAATEPASGHSHAAPILDRTSVRQRRYQVWAEQQKANHELCFGTARRYICDAACPWRAECLSLRAEWMR